MDLCFEMFYAVIDCIKRTANIGLGRGVMASNEEQLSGEMAYKPSRRTELIAFLILAFAIWPVVAVGVVGGYGFLVWMWQIVFGPPGPPGGMVH